MNEKPQNAGSSGMVEKTFYGKNEDHGDSNSKVTLLQILCGLSKSFNLSEFLQPDL